MTLGMPEKQQLDLSWCRERLAQSNSVLIEGQELTDVPLLNDGELVRGWKEGTPAAASMMRYYLDKFTDAENENEMYWVKDPVIQGTTYKGTWRQAFTKRVLLRNEYWVIQILRQGWAETITWVEARKQKAYSKPGNSQYMETPEILPASTISDDPEKFLFVLFPNFSPFHVDAALDSLGNTINDVTIQGELFSGEWHKVRAEVELQQDGSSHITVTMARPQYTLEAYSNVGGADYSIDTYLWQVPKDIAQTILDAGENVVGLTARPTYRGDLVDIVFSYVSVDTLWAHFHSQESQLGTADTVIYENWSTPIDAYNIGDVSDPNYRQGAVYRSSNSFNRRGGYDGRLVYDYSYPDIAQFTSARTFFKTTEALAYKNSRSVIDSPDSVDSGKYRVNQQENEDGTYSGIMEYTSGVADANAYFHSLDSGVQGDDTWLYKSANTAAFAQVASQGKIWRAGNSITEEGLYDGRAVKSLSIENITDYIYARNARLMYGYEKIYRNARQAVRTPLFDGTYQGWTYDAAQRLNDDLTYDGKQVARKANPDDIYFTFNSRYGTAWKYRFVNQDSLPSMYFGYLELGQNNNATVLENLDGTYSGEVSSAPPGAGGSSFTLETTQWRHDKYQFRVNPLNRVEEKRQVSQWFYSKYFADESACADWVSYQFLPSISTRQGFWHGVYAHPPTFYAWF